MSDPLLPIGYRFLALDSVGSTNDEAGERAVQGEADGLVIMARTQSAGRGRRGRQWESPPGNLYLSLLIAPGRPMPEAAQLSFVTALAMAETVKSMSPHFDIRCKWPNDVLVQDCKVAGILIEGAARNLVIVGIGVNLAHHPPETLYPATSLASLGLCVTPDDFVGPLVERFDNWRRRWLAEGFASVRPAWLGFAKGLGQPVAARLPDREIHGIFRDIDMDGALLVEGGNGTQRILAADVFFPVGRSGA